MSNGLIIALIIVVWLFVLAPLFMRGQKLIRKAGEGFDDTRVIHEGGSGELPVRRRPRLSAADVRRPADDYDIDDADLELVDDVLLDDEPAPRSRFRGLFTRQEPADEATPAEIVDGGIVHELEAGDTATSEAEYDEWDDWDEDTTYAYDDTYTSPSDMMYPDSVDSIVEVVEDADEENSQVSETAESAAADSEPLEDDLSEEEIEFAEHRAARGGWDPVADAEHSVDRYQRRQRTLIVLAAAVVLTAIVAFIVGGWTWALAGIAVAATVVYLAALRTQVREEQALRHRRIRQLRRARLGVLNAADEELAIPSHLRRPGAVILERDDESPDFDHLPVVDYHFEEEEPAPVRTFRRPPRFSDDRRAG
ncbi:MAG: hypothetical protein Q4G50_06465 [Corynebacterium sp.]|uniref:divisome protein SepX/GlpR n=1 Tax=Corynebacterium sp. TaxID=1720 RepID=UPI0026DF5391|nr:gephyrin-like molybdotransferase receptor GlpR [Corynebacterium sp.]MDO5669628.1 hypothetical protein [Corynebacterium sp.]